MIGKILDALVLQTNILYIFNKLINILQLTTMVDNPSSDSADTYISYPIQSSKSKLKKNLILFNCFLKSLLN